MSCSCRYFLGGITEMIVITSSVLKMNFFRLEQILYYLISLFAILDKDVIERRKEVHK
jgi:hypothetical protein